MMIEKIKKLCKKRNITITELERKLEFSRGSITKWEDNKPSYDKVLKVAEYFNVPFNYLIGINTEKDPDEDIIIINYRKADKRGKENIKMISEIEAKRAEKS